jgi:uncharacterized RDD family membrane protein YckC
MEEINQNTQPLFENDPTQCLNLEITYEYASTGQRFLNYLIDNLLMRYGLSYLTEIALGMILQIVAPEYLQKIAFEQTTLDMLLLAYLIAIINYTIYYTICEKAFKGYTLGKLITGTRAIRVDGEELTFKDALLRSLSRFVPFEAFSGFGGHPWHDRWTNTMVIKSR